ncbi:MAG: hypothetical protein OXN84_09025 [Albidovulum sp.]|nr:hypothetical protein [Albidovulum sp.]
MEFAPVEVADFDTRRSKRIAMGMCCGSVCDVQILLSCEALGTNTGRYSLHSKKYAGLASEGIYLLSIGVEAFRSFFRVIADGVGLMIQPLA